MAAVLIGPTTDTTTTSTGIRIHCDEFVRFFRGRRVLTNVKSKKETSVSVRDIAGHAVVASHNVTSMKVTSSSAKLVSRKKR
jgi:hypothetical protein